MALPIIPIILAVAALGSGIAQGISASKNAKAEMKAVQETNQEQVKARAKAAKKLMQEQKTSFLKSGIYFDSGTPLDVINETYDTYKQDVAAMNKDANAKIKNLQRQGKTAFYSSILEGVANAALSYFGAGGTTGLAKGLGSSSGTSGMASNKFMSIWQNISGNYRGGFGSVGNGSTTKIV